MAAANGVSQTRTPVTAGAISPIAPRISRIPITAIPRRPTAAIHGNRSTARSSRKACTDPTPTMTSARPTWAIQRAMFNALALAREGSPEAEDVAGKQTWLKPA